MLYSPLPDHVRPPVPLRLSRAAMPAEHAHAHSPTPDSNTGAAMADGPLLPPPFPLPPTYVAGPPPRLKSEVPPTRRKMTGPGRSSGGGGPGGRDRHPVAGLSLTSLRPVRCRGQQPTHINTCTRTPLQHCDAEVAAVHPGGTPESPGSPPKSAHTPLYQSLHGLGCPSPWSHALPDQWPAPDLVPHAACCAAVPQVFTLTSKQAARSLGVGHSCLKRYCRRIGMSRWPYRKLASLDAMRDVIESDAHMDPRDKQVGGLGGPCMAHAARHVGHAAACRGTLRSMGPQPIWWDGRAGGTLALSATPQDELTSRHTGWRRHEARRVDLSGAGVPRSSHGPRRPRPHVPTPLPQTVHTLLAG